ncbi:MAG: T9SS type A sorting domain-containing protein, partial [Cytophagales bacterium]|nr:T9SS type A sorting domain-containing protein [Cytophagales bacterium]
TATVTIAKKALTVSADGKSRAYNTANPTFTLTYNGFVGSENASVLDVQPTIGTSATQSSNAGLYPITVAGGMDNNYAMTYIAGTLTVTKIAPTLNITSANVGQTGTNIPLAASSNSTGAVTWSIVSGNGTIVGNSVNLGAAGSVTIQANLAADVNYTAATVQQTISITTQSVPTIQFSNSSKTYGDPVFLAAATSNSLGAMTYSITSGNPFASIHPTLGTVTILGAGTVTIKVDQAANGSFAASSKTATLTIAQKALTVTADGKSRGYNSPNPAFTLSYSGFVNGENASVIDVLPTAATSATQTSNVGTYAIVPSGGLDNNYSFAYANGILTVTSIDPSLTITSTNSGQAGSTIALTASSNSIGAISWSVISGNGSLAGSTLTLLNAGSVTVQANVAATTNYNAFSVQQTITIGAQTVPTISFADVVKTVGDNSFTVSATSNSSGALTYSVISGNGFASIDPNTGLVTILGAGTVTLQVSQAANGTYAAATKTANLTINKATRSISITSANIGAAGTQIALTASVSPTATVVWSVTNGTGAASVNGAVLDLLSSGTVTLNADVPADANYLAASASQTVTISAVTGVSETLSASKLHWSVYPNPFQATATIALELPEASMVTIHVYNSLGMEVATLLKEANLAAGAHAFGLEGLTSGAYVVKLTANGTVSYTRVIKE